MGVTGFIIAIGKESIFGAVHTAKAVAVEELDDAEQLGEGEGMIFVGVRMMKLRLAFPFAFTTHHAVGVGGVRSREHFVVVKMGVAVPVQGDAGPRAFRYDGKDNGRVRINGFEEGACGNHRVRLVAVEEAVVPVTDAP